MGILSSEFGAKIFFTLWWSLASWLLSLALKGRRGEGNEVVGGASPRSTGFVFFPAERFLFVFRERFFLLGQSAIRKRAHKGLTPAL
jgi:hypothetical protein